MNYLAHCALSGDNPLILTGNLLEDYTKGSLEHPKFSLFPHELVLGLKLHRRIDHFTDTSSVLKSAKELFYPFFGKYSPALLDILLDHFLSIQWKSFYTQDLQNFCFETYKKLNETKEWQVPQMQSMVKSMTKHNWLMSYANFNDLEFVLSRFTMKVNNGLKFTEGIKIMQEHYEEISAIFTQFYAQIMVLCSEFIEDKENGNF